MSYRSGRTIVFLFLFSTAASLEADYFWREYVGKIPEDAVIAGQDANGDNVYIGQGYVKNEGQFPAPIIPGVKEIYVPQVGPKLAKYVKILCGVQENFVWVPTSASSLHLDMLKKLPIIGGQEDNLGSTYVGRISYNGGTQVGKINAFSVGDAGFWFINKEMKEQESKSFEVLVYQNNNR